MSHPLQMPDLQVITTLKWSLRRLCFHTGLSVYRGVLVSVWGVSVWGVSVWGVSVQGVSVWGVSVWGVSVSGVSVRGWSLSWRAPRMVTSRRYASYWNAFLLTNVFHTEQRKIDILYGCGRHCKLHWMPFITTKTIQSVWTQKLLVDRCNKIF